MPISHGDQVFGLIKSLSKAEKRNFRLYVRRIQGEGDVLFMQLFDLLEKLDELTDEEAVRLQLKNSSKSQYSNLKRHLYQHILTSLRLMHIKKDKVIQIREWIDYAHILYGRGLYLQALKLLAKAKTQAEAIHLDFLHGEIIEFEKRIESRHITRATTQRMIELTDEARDRSKINGTIVQLSNLKLLLQRQFINQGHQTDPDSLRRLKADFVRQMPIIREENLSFFEKIYLFQARYWQHYLLLDYKSCVDCAISWVQLFDNQPQMRLLDMDMYMRAIHHVLSIAFLLQDEERFSRYQRKLEIFHKEHHKNLNDNSRVLSFLLIQQSRYNLYFLQHNYQKATEQIPATLGGIRTYGKLVDPHKIYLLYYKMAWASLLNRQPAKTIDFLNHILNQEGPPLRKDIYVYSQLLFMLAHYDLKNYDLVDYLWDAANRHVQQLQEQQELPLLLLKQIRLLLRSAPDQEQSILLNFQQALLPLREKAAEIRGLRFLDPSVWIEQRIQKQLWVRQAGV